MNKPVKSSRESKTDDLLRWALELLATVAPGANPCDGWLAERASLTTEAKRHLHLHVNDTDKE